MGFGFRVSVRRGDMILVMLDIFFHGFRGFLWSSLGVTVGFVTGQVFKFLCGPNPNPPIPIPIHTV